MTSLGLGKLGARVCALGAVVSSLGWGSARTAAAAPPDAAPPPTPLRILNYSSYFSDKTLDEHFREKLAPPTLAHLAKSHDALWLYMTSVSLKNGSNYCIASIGLTEDPPKGRNGRIPAVLSWGASRSNTRGPLTDAQLNGCMSNALDSATADFAPTPLETNLADIERTREKGSRKSEPVSKEIAQISVKGLSREGMDALFQYVPLNFRTAFDYRKLQWSALGAHLSFGQQIVCIAMVGVVGRAPVDRNTRFPARTFHVLRELTVEQSKAPNAGQTCVDDVAASALRDALETTWDDKGLLLDFSFAQEAGVPPVANFRRPPEPSPGAQQAQFRQSLKVGTETHCGLVIEVRPPIVKVQTMIGERWLKAAQLYPPGRRDCRFVNGVYQDPD